MQTDKPINPLTDNHPGLDVITSTLEGGPHCGRTREIEKLLRQRMSVAEKGLEGLSWRGYPYLGDLYRMQAWIHLRNDVTPYTFTIRLGKDSDNEILEAIEKIITGLATRLSEGDALKAQIAEAEKHRVMNGRVLAPTPKKLIIPK
jgi:hypothetical protein